MKRRESTYELVQIIDQKDWYILKIIEISSNIHELIQTS